MLDTLILSIALLTPAKRDTCDRLPPVAGASFAPSSISFDRGERELIAPPAVASLETRPTVKVARPNIWTVNE